MQVIYSANRIETCVCLCVCVCVCVCVYIYIYVVIWVWLVDAALTNMFVYCF